MQYTITALSILISFTLGYFAGRKYAIIRYEDRKPDAIDDAYSAVKDALTPTRSRIISPSKEKATSDLLKGLEDE